MNEFGAQQIQTSKYWYEKLPYTYEVSNMAAGKTPLFQVNSISSVDRSKMAIMSDLAITNNQPGVYLDVWVDTDHRVINGLGFPPNLEPIVEGPNGFATSGKLAVQIDNNSSAAIAGITQVNYSVAVKTLTVAEKIMRGMSLNAPENQLAQKYGLTNIGNYPFSTKRMLERAFESRVLAEFEYADEVNFTTAPVSISSEQPRSPSEILVLRKIAAQAPAGSQATINITRDGDNNYVSILADNMTLANPIDCWIPSMQTLTISVQAAANVNNIPIRLTYKRIALSTLILAMFGKLHTNSLSPTDQELYNKVMAGVIV